MEIYFDDREFGRLARIFARGDPLLRLSVKAALRRSGTGMRKDIGKGVREKSYLRGRTVSGAIGRLAVAGDEASVRVAAPNQPAFRFRLAPNRVTARKGSRSTSWRSPNVLKGPGLAPLNPRLAGYSRPFIAVINGRKAMYARELHTGRLTMPRIASPQYFAAFSSVSEPIMEQAGQTFLRRLSHEIDYRLGALR